MSKSKKTLQLGMNPSTAQGRLVKDLLFSLAIKTGHTCYQCGEELTRETMSIEHKTPWLDSEDPLRLFFDLDNVGFSHLSCNISASRNTNKKYFTKEEKDEAENLNQVNYNVRRRLAYKNTDKVVRSTLRKKNYEQYGC